MGKKIKLLSYMYIAGHAIEPHYPSYLGPNYMTSFNLNRNDTFGRWTGLKQASHKKTAIT